MTEDRPATFQEAREHFRSFLFKERWSTNCVWLPEERARRGRGFVLLFQPDVHSDETAAASMYESIMRTASSVKFIGIAQQAKRTIVVIKRYVGVPGRFYMSLSLAVPKLVEVRSSILWRLRALDPKLKSF